MASRMASGYGREEDKNFCSFYVKVGACRHGDKCNRIHIRPESSPTVLIPHMYPNPAAVEGGVGVEGDEESFCNFYRDVFNGVSQYGQVDDIYVCANLCQHLLGNVYVKYHTEDAARAAVDGLRGRCYAGRVLAPELSPVTDFRNAQCSQFADNCCARENYCNFLHLVKVPFELRRELFPAYRDSAPPRSKSRERKSSSRHRSGRHHSRRHHSHRRHGRHHRSPSASSSSSSSGSSSASSRSSSPEKKK